MNAFGTSAMFHSDVFDAFFEPYRPDNIPTEEFLNKLWIRPSSTAFLALRDIDSSFVWSIVSDGHSRDMYCSPGFRIVNREAYVVTRKAHDFISIDFCEYWHRPFLSQLGLKRELTKLKQFLALCELASP